MCFTKKLWICELQVPDCCIAILLGLVFCVIQPLMTPIALSYFLINSILYKYQLIYVHKPQFESGGMVIPVVPLLQTLARAP